VSTNFYSEHCSAGQKKEGGNQCKQLATKIPSLKLQCGKMNIQKSNFLKQEQITPRKKQAEPRNIFQSNQQKSKEKRELDSKI